ncbi:MarR family transcriptional regulator [Candidatus Pelagibacter communis]|uniref:MarR family transcriptional regulator n=1 Tax=Pelagibacter ubique TaxID=198252 RepID=UPI00065B43C8|nr:MarR family transcriptional regulator [Candidatus Pelagibacter ubique]
MSTLPSISDALDEKMVTSVINKKFNNFVPAFYKFVSEWIINAYSNFKDIEMYMVLIYLVNNDFKFYRKNGIQVDYNTFYKDKTLEIEEIKIIEISRDLQIPKESVRRKIIYLEKIGVIKRTRKKIFIDRSAYETVQPISALKNISYLVSISSKILKQENKIPNSFSSNEITDTIKNNFSYCWYEFYKFIFSYFFRWRKETKDLETLCVALLIISNASSSKNFIIQDIDIEKWRKRISFADKIGLNSMSISDITGIPRPTVVRKVNSLIKKGYAKMDQKKLISVKIDEKIFSKTQKIQEQTVKEISELIYKILNKATIN